MNPRQNASVETGRQSRRAFHEWQLAEGHADEREAAAWLIYEMSSATEGPSTALSVLRYGLLACALVGLVGSAVIFATGK